ncbi:nSTAND1 domain-containing NTPase [Merismopedia glauca]|uniref:Uncharacterized protein n=1 Tax=Merismopedia glauca CCAP 1448/3 TaxID=1296344 RepID=A0A2T1C307_9CYAN|nr:caspase family protein [Merismopedia glauca]PSB02650.1 hypothetical protein C7B64_12110 [Merismopedia glauca CCAP 1448/3]
MSPLSIRTSRSILDLETGAATIWVLPIGVNQYHDPELPALRYSAFDCQGFASALATATETFPKKHMRIHHDFAPQLPLLKQVRDSLGIIAAQAQSQDTVVFYFSGHGILDPTTGEAVLCLADTKTNNLVNTALSLAELLQTLERSLAHNQLICLDACHSGGLSLRKQQSFSGKTPDEPQGLVQPAIQVNPVQGSKSGAINPLTNQLVQVLQQRAARSQGFYALLSSDRAQQSWEFPELGHGVFTYYLMQGLRGEASDDAGLITADGLYSYVFHQTLQYIDQTNQQLRLVNQHKASRGEKLLQAEYPLQTPKRIVEGVGELILGVKPQQVKASVSSRKAIVIDGFGNPETLAFSKLISRSGNFDLTYWHPQGKQEEDLQQILSKSLGDGVSSLEEKKTLLLYVRSQIEQTSTGESVLILGEDVKLARSWLRQLLRRCLYSQQIVILDFPTPIELTGVILSLLKDWLEDLQVDSHIAQCFIAGSSLADRSETFTHILVRTLARASNNPEGLTIASWIPQLQQELAGSNVPWQISLAGTKAVMEVLPTQNGKSKTSIDLGICPYKGLRAFTEADAQYFYGRDSLTQELIQKLSLRSLLPVVGASGSGKSSVVQAGLVAKLRQGRHLPGSEQWWIRTLRPSDRPMQALSRSLVDAKTEKDRSYQQKLLEGILYQGLEGFVYWLRTRSEPMVVLVVDQFEELFTLASAIEREQFLNLILGAIELAPDKFKVVITLRADFMASCLEIPQLANLLQSHSVLVPAKLTSDDYRQAILQPAETVGLKVEPDLIAVLLQELDNSAADLPLLQFLLEQLWEQRIGGKLTLQTYLQQIGGLKGALEQKAQSVYDSLDPEAQRCTQWIFLSLTQLGEGTEDTRRRIPKSDLVVAKYPPELVERTLKALTDAKLVVVSCEEEVGTAKGQTSQELPNSGLKPQEISVEVAHEILIRHWSTLRWWLQENRARLSLQRQVEAAARLWQENAHQSDFLLQGVRLGAAEEIYIKYTDELSTEVQHFLEACLAARNEQQLQAKKRLRQTQAVAVGAIALGILAMGLGSLAYVQGEKAALSEVSALKSLSLASLSSNHQLEALVASLKAAKKWQHQRKLLSLVPGSDYATHEKLMLSVLMQTIYETQERNRLLGHGSWVTTAIFSPNGQIIASASVDRTIKLWKVDGTLIQTLTGHTQGVNSVTFSPDGQILASASSDRTIKLWKVDGTLIKTLTGHTDSVLGVSFSADGQQLASVSSDRTIKIWTVDGQLVKNLPGTLKQFTVVKFNPQFTTLAVGNSDGSVELWNQDGKFQKTLGKHSAEVDSLAFSPDGQALVSGSEDGTLKLWQLEQGTQRTLSQNNEDLPRREGPIKSVSFSPDGKYILSAGGDAAIRLWSVDGSLLATFLGHTRGINSVSFSPVGATMPSGIGQSIISASDDQTVRIWHWGEVVPTSLVGHESDIVGLNFSPDGQTLASSSQDGTVKLWNWQTKTLLNTLRGHTSWLTSVSFSPDGQTLVSASADKTMKVWTSAGNLLQTLSGHQGWVISANFSPIGLNLVSGSADGTIKLWERPANTSLFASQPKATLTGHTGWVTSVSFSPDAQLIASASADKTVKIWNLKGELIHTLEKHLASVWDVSFSPDGQLLGSASQDGTINLWQSNGTWLKTLEGHENEVNTLAFSPDSQLIASGSDDDTMKIWNREGDLLKTLSGHGGNIRSVAFSLDGHTLATGSSDRTIKLWDLRAVELQKRDLNSLISVGCQEVRDYLKTNSKIEESDRSLCDS